MDVPLVMTSIYQKEIADARKKCMEAKKIVAKRDLPGKSVIKWVETKNRGLKICEILVR